MFHSMSCVLVHLVFATKDRSVLIPRALQARLYPLIRDTVREVGGSPIETNGAGDHVHSFCGIPPSIPVSKMVQRIKGRSSRWLGMTSELRGRFAWQAGYTAFSVSPGKADSVSRYIQSQTSRHGMMTLEQELRRFELAFRTRGHPIAPP